MDDCVQRATAGESVGRPPLYRALEALDRFLEPAVDRAAHMYGPQAALDGLRGLHLGHDDVRRAMERLPGAPSLATPAAALHEALRADERFAWLIEAYGLTDIEAAIVLIALAPEADLRYERIYAYLQDDVTRTRPGVDLVLNLLCSTTAEKLARRTLVDAGSALVSQRVVTLEGPAAATLLARELRVDPQIAAVLLGSGGIDPRLCEWCRLHRPDAAALPAHRALVGDLARLAAAEPRLALLFEGPHGTGKWRAAQGLAAARGQHILLADLASAAASDLTAKSLELLARESWLHDTLLYVRAPGPGDVTRSYELSCALFSALARYPSLVVVAAARGVAHQPPAPAACRRVIFDMPDAKSRLAHWREQLALHGLRLRADDLHQLTRAFALSYDQIADVAASASAGARFRPGRRRPALADLCSAARSHCGHELATVARRVEPRAGWGDIVLPDDAMAQLREICMRATHGQRVLGDWGFGRKLTLGKGVNALFAGPSGTGKTLAAEIVAHELGYDLYKIDLSGIVSKYIGETERNLDRVFRAAHRANAVLFFDEADALFGKRSEVRDAHDRYANIEISYLLQKMEEFEGIAILATNLRQNLDDAFTRRLAFTIHFPFPEEKDRLAIWTSVWPREVPLAADVDLPALAREFKLAGGNIKNTALAAAYIAAADGGVVTQAHVLRATRREYQKMGKNIARAGASP